MEMLQFKTNINCGNCVAKVTPALNAVVGSDNWRVDTENPLKLLTVETENSTARDIIIAVSKAGFKIEELDN